MFAISHSVFWLSAALCAAASPALAELRVVWSASAPEAEVKSWDLSALKGMKSASSSEKDPVTSRIVAYKGVLLSTAIEKAMEGMPADRKAQVDLLVLRSSTGAQVLLPRSVVVKYPVLLALASGQVSLVMPWTSKPKILAEDLPIETYFISDVVRVELSNYRERFGGVFLKHRMDPGAIRGEKLFVQTCVGCHSDGAKTITTLSEERSARKFASDGHPANVKGVPALNERNRRAVVNYLDTFRSENATKTAGN